MQRKLCLFALLVACTPKKGIISAPGNPSTSQVDLNRASALPDDATSDPAAAPSTLTVTYSRADATAALVWTHPSQPANGAFNYEIYSNELDASGKPAGASKLLLSADSSVLSAVVDVELVSGSTPIFNVIARSSSASRELGAATGNPALVFPLITRTGAAMITAECHALGASSNGLHIFAATLNSQSAAPAVAVAGEPGSTNVAAASALALQSDQTVISWVDKNDYVINRRLDQSVAAIAGSGPAASDLPNGAFLSSGNGLVAVVGDTSVEVFQLAGGAASPLLSSAQSNTGVVAGTLGVAWLSSRPNTLLAAGQSPDFTSFIVTSYDFSVSPPAVATANMPTTIVTAAVTGLLNQSSTDGVANINVAASESGAIFPYHTVDGSYVGIAASVDPLTGALSTGSTIINSDSFEAFIMTPRMGLSVAQTGTATAVSDNGLYVAAYGHDSGAANPTPPCLIVSALTAQLTLTHDDFSTCKSGASYAALPMSHAYAGTYDNETAGNSYFLPSSFGHGNLLIEDLQAGAPAAWNLVTISGTTPTLASGGVLATCPVGASQSSFWFYQHDSDPNANPQRLGLLCAGDTFGYGQITNLQPGPVPVLPTQSGVSFAEPFGTHEDPQTVGIYGYDANAATPSATLQVLDLRNGAIVSVDPSLTTEYVEDNGALAVSGDLQSALFANLSYNFDVPITPAPTCSDFSNWIAGQSEPTRLTLLRNNGAALLVKQELLAQLPAGAPAGTPFFLEAPSYPAGSDYFVFTLGFMGAGDVINCDPALDGGVTGVDPAKVRVYGIDMKTCSDTGCTINDITPSDWSCGGANLADVHVSINPISFAN